MSAPNLKGLEGFENEALEIELQYNDYLVEMAETISADKELKKIESNSVKRIKNTRDQKQKLEKSCHMLEKRIIDIEYLTASSDAIEWQLEQLDSKKGKGVFL